MRARTIMHDWKLVLAAWLLCALACPLAFGQALEKGLSLRPAPRKVSLPTLYRFFLAFQLHLDRAADAMDQKGERASGLRDHYQKRLGFTPAEFALVRDAAIRLEAQLKQQDAKAQAVIDDVHARFPPGAVTGPKDLPPPSPELVRLQQERNALIKHEVDRLKASLGPALAGKLDKFLQSDFAPDVQVQSVGPPLARHPGQRPAAPFPQEVRP